MLIEELKKENSILQKIKNNSVPQNFCDINYSTLNNTNRINNNNIHIINPPVNVIAPRNDNEFNGTIAFFNNPVKNIQKFINIKNVNLNNNSIPVPQHNSTLKSSSVKSLKDRSRAKNKIFSLKQRRINSVDNISKNDHMYNSTMGSISPNASWLDNTNSSLMVNNSTISIGKNKSFYIGKPKPSRVTKELLGKSYEVVKKYQQKVK